MSNKPHVSVIIPTLNEAPRVLRAIKSAWVSGADQVIVADGGSSDDTRQVAAAADAIVLTCQRGRAAQQNAGADVAHGDVLLFLHADNWLAKSAIAELGDAYRASEPFAGAFRQKIDAPGLSFRLLEWGNGWRVRLFRQPYGDQGIFVNSRLFRAVGRFPDVPLMEELLLMRRIRATVRPVLLNGPIHVDARRWQQQGILRQTLHNWSLLARYLCGVSPQRLASAYPNHDQAASSHG